MNDLLMLDGADVRGLPLLERKRLLRPGGLAVAPESHRWQLLNRDGGRNARFEDLSSRRVALLPLNE